MNQHFVPQFYLKNFSQNGKQIFVYDKAIHKSFSCGISSVASQQSFYDNRDNQSMENEIGKLEGNTAGVLKKLIEALLTCKFERINKEDKDILIQFIWLGLGRFNWVSWLSLQPSFSRLFK